MAQETPPLTRIDGLSNCLSHSELPNPQSLITNDFCEDRLWLGIGYLLIIKHYARFINQPKRIVHIYLFDCNPIIFYHLTILHFLFTNTITSTHKSPIFAKIK